MPVSSGTVPSLILRAPDSTATATIARLVGATWQALPTVAAGQPGIYLTNVDALGDFALIEPVTSLLGLDPTLARPWCGDRLIMGRDRGRGALPKPSIAAGKPPATPRRKPAIEATP